jgi:hypothetical protein
MWVFTQQNTVFSPKICLLQISTGQWGKFQHKDNKRFSLLKLAAAGLDWRVL